MTRRALPSLPDPDSCVECRMAAELLAVRRGPGFIWRRHRCPMCGARWSTWQSRLSLAAFTAEQLARLRSS